MKQVSILMCVVLFPQLSPAQDAANGMRGDPAAIAEAEAMVETMGGMELWAQLESLHFVHEWYPWYRIDSYVENEILDLTGPRSWADRRSEIYQKTRVYSPEGKYWTVVDGEFAYGSDEIFEAAPANTRLGCLRQPDDAV